VGHSFTGHHEMRSLVRRVNNHAGDTQPLTKERAFKKGEGDADL